MALTTMAFVENDFGPGAAGALSFNVMAAVAQYYSENQRSEVIKGMDEKVRQGLAPFGYRPGGRVAGQARGHHSGG